MPEVSIIIPAYNQDIFLEETLKSVLAQTYRDFECIIIDDGSTDSTLEISKKYADYKKVKYFYQENKGLAGARNTGIRLAKSKYIHFLDSDDIVNRNFLENMVNKLDNNEGVDVLSCAWILIDEAGREISSKIGPVRSNNYFMDLILKNLFPVHAVILKKNIFDDVGLFNEKLAALEDWDMWLRIAMRNYKFDVLDEIGVKYRRHGRCMTLKLDRMMKNLQFFLDNFYSSNPKYMKYRQYTNVLYMLKIYLYSEVTGDINYQNNLIKGISNLISTADYNHNYFIKTYEEIRNIRSKEGKMKLFKNIYNKSPKEYKNFWRLKILKTRAKNLLNL